MTEITSYTNLKTALREWFRDRVQATTYADEAIGLFEAFANTEIRHRKMVTKTDLTPTDNVYTLPSDYEGYVKVVEKASIRRRLRYMPTTAVDDHYPSRVAGLSCHFTIEGDELTAFPLSSNDIELVYFQSLPALTSSNESNWLLAKFPNLYLHGSLLYLAELLGVPKKLETESRFVEAMVERINGTFERDMLAQSEMYISGPTP